MGKGKETTREPASQPQWRHVAQPVSPRTVPAPAPWGLLLVDDEPDVIATLKDLVQGFFEGVTAVTVRTASSGRDGLEILASNLIHVVVSDFRMPGMDGIEFLAQVKRLHPGVRRMLFTAFVDAELARRAASDAVVEDFLSKKLDPSEFLWTVAELIQKTGPGHSARPSGTAGAWTVGQATEGQGTLEVHDLHRAAQDEPRMAGAHGGTAAKGAIQESLARMAAPFESSMDCIVTKDLAGNITSWNEACRALFGYEAVEALGNPVTLLYPEGKGSEEDAILESIGGGTPVHIAEAERVRKDGTTIWVSVSASPVRDGAGNVVGGADIQRDVTQRRAEEAQLRRLASVVRDSNDAITVQDLTGRFQAWNRGAEQMYGYTEAEALGMNNSQLVPESERERALDLMRQIQSGRPVDSVELQRVTKDGRTLDVWLTITKLLDHQQDIVGFATTERDITERRGREQERWEAQERILEVARLNEVNRFTTQFINMAAHELWTPLMPLRTQVHLLLNSKATPLAASQRQALGLIERNVERLGALVEDLLTVARSQAGRLGIDVQSVDLGGLVAEACDGYQAVAKGRGIELTVQHGSALAIAADPKRVPQVLANLLSNALKFTPKGGHVHVAVADGATLVRISVTDDGMGIAEADVPRLFNPFVQLHDTAEVTAPGSGLGLYICKQFIEMHGGSVGAESPGRGQGSTFWFTLPKAEPRPNLSAVASGQPTEPAMEPPTPRDAPALQEAYL